MQWTMVFFNQSSSIRRLSVYFSVTLSLLLLSPRVNSFHATTVSPFHPKNLLVKNPYPPSRLSLIDQNNDRSTRTHSTSHSALSASLSSSLSLLSPKSFSFPLIGPHDTWGNWMVLSGNAALAMWMSRTTAIGKLMGPPITAMALSFLWATVGVLATGGTAAATALQQLTLHMATPLVLLGADFRNARQRCGPLLVTFVLAAAATVAGSAVGWWCLGDWITASLGGTADGLKIAAALMARNVGGGLNYMAVCSTLQASPTAIAAGLCADNIFGLFYFPIASWIANGRPDPALEDQESTPMETSMDETAINTSSAPVDQSITVESVTAVTFVSTVLLWLGNLLGGARGMLPMTTLLTVLLINRVAPVNWVQSIQPTSSVLGTVALYVFFATLGSQGVAVADSVRNSMAPLSLFLLLLYALHATTLWGLHKVFGRHSKSMSPQRLLVASSASIGGPATAVALAQAQKWKSLEMPGLLVGNLGDAIGTFLGIAYFAFFQKALG